MATSGTFGSAWDVHDLLTEAWERCGKSPDILNAETMRGARRSLYLLLVEWTNIMPPLWQVDEETLTLTVGINTYTLAPETTDILDAWLIQPGQTVRSVMTGISRDDWAMLPDITTRGRPTQFWVERLRDAPVLHLYMAPDAAYTLGYYRIRAPEAVTAGAETVDAPILWTDALAAGLAARLSVKHAPDRAAMLKAEAKEAFALASGENRERPPITIAPVVWP